MTDLAAYRQGPMISRRRAAGMEPTPQLTIALATRQARKHVDKMMPGAGATVESKGSWDVATDTQTVVTTVTFPRGHEMALMLACTLATLPGYLSYTRGDSSITLTRKVK